eukprot:SAG11_NODE_806_length_7093_cov_1.965379_9_plen_172_part_00
MQRDEPSPGCRHATVIRPPTAVCMPSGRKSTGCWQFPDRAEVGKTWGQEPGHIVGRKRLQSPSIKYDKQEHLAHIKTFYALNLTGWPFDEEPMHEGFFSSSDRQLVSGRYLGTQPPSPPPFMESLALLDGLLSGAKSGGVATSLCCTGGREYHAKCRVEERHSRFCTLAGM